MKFDDRYPDTKLWEEPQESVILVIEKLPCQVCKQLTWWRDIDYLVPVCSDECLQQLG